MNGRPWTAADLRTLRRLYPGTLTRKVAAVLGRNESSVYGKANLIGLKKNAAFLASQESGRLSKFSKAGEAHRFKPGHTTWNKGTHYVAGGRSPLTRFKKGNRSKRWDLDAYALGALRITTDGCLLIKATPSKHRRSWKVMARFVWETERGRIPPNHVIRAKNGDAHDTRIENLECISRRENIRRNYHARYPLELRRLIQLRGALQRQINKREGKHERQHDQRPA